MSLVPHRPSMVSRRSDTPCRRPHPNALAAPLRWSLALAPLAGSPQERSPLMQAAVWREPGHVVVEDRPEPHCPPGWALVRSERVGLCGSDFSIVAGHHGRATPPLVLGHEMVGTVHADGPGAPPRGTRVVVNPLLPCGECWPCQHELR